MSLKYLMIFIICIPTLVLSEYKILKQSSQSVLVEIVLEDFQENSLEKNGAEFSLFQFKDGILDDQFGTPAIPHLQTRLAIPLGARVSYQVINVESDSRRGITVVPLGMLDFPDRNPEQLMNQEIYNAAFPFPETEVNIGAEYDYRGINVVPLRIYPIRYFPGSQEVQIFRRMQILFEFKDGQARQIPVTVSQSEQQIIRHKVINYEQAALFGSQPALQLKKVFANYDLSFGEWFRIPIQEEGIYQISGALLRSAGVEIDNVQLNTIQIFNHGGFALPYSVLESRPQDLNEIAIQVQDNNNNGLMDDDDWLRFYGKGLGGHQPVNINGTISWQYQGNPDGSRTLHPYDETNYYLMTFNSQVGKRILSLTSPQNTNPHRPNRFWDYQHIEVDENNILSSGLDWYWLKMTGTSDSKSTPFNIPQNLSNDSVRVEFRFHGGSGSLYGTVETFRYNLKVLLNSQIILDNILFTNNATLIRTYQGTSLYPLQGGLNQLEIQHIGNLDGCEVFLDNFEISVKRPFIAENNSLHFRDIVSANSPVEYNVTGLPAGQNRVWDVTDLENVRNIEPLQGGQNVVFQGLSSLTEPKEYYVYAPSAVRNVGGLEALPNWPNLRDPSRRAEFIIITPTEFYDDAQFLEDWRESQFPDPLQTERIDLEQIFVEFSSSVRDVTAIRDFIKYAYENWSDTLKYVLLFGDGHFDYRGLRLPDVPNWMPPFEITNNGEIDSRETDNFYVAFGMSGNLGSIDPTLPIGRLPVGNLEQIEIYRDKAEKYRNSYLFDQDKNGWQTWLTFVSDDEVGGPGSNHELSYHLRPTEAIINSKVPKKFNVSKVYLHDYDKIPGGLGRWKPKATEDLINQINRGTLMINFFGHGDPDTWAHESVLNRSRDLPKFQNDYRLPIWVAATCTWGKFDNPSRPSMSEELIWLSQMGGIGVISASRPVYVSGNTAFTTNFYDHLFNTRSEFLPSKLIGDAFHLATSFSTNFQKFHLYGDPTLKLADPQYRINILSIEPDTLKALTTVTVTAQVLNTDETLFSNFEGSALLQVFDATDKEFVVDGSERYDYVYNGGTIFKGLVSVRNGELVGNFIVPKSIKYDPTPSGRLSIYAWSEELGDAIGYNDSLMLYGTESQVTDQEGPEISVSFKDSPNFFDGDFVSNQPTLLVELSDENGINLTGEVGHKIELIIDENMKKDVTEFFVYEKDSYRKGKLEYTLPALGTGTHQVKVSCWDNLNNYTEKLVAFRTSAANDLMLTEVVNFPNPFNDQTYFTFQLVSPTGAADVTISIYTVTGRKIYEIRDFAEQGFNKLPREGWDGRDWDGDLIANGVYLYKVDIDDGIKKNEQIEKLAVVR
ncbi:MAG: type IX secretion system sortase PorU [bacterium]|nr:MAG: type IX secretion system sortase PorU [bacterium]